MHGHVWPVARSAVRHADGQVNGQVTRRVALTMSILHARSQSTHGLCHAMSATSVRPA